MTDSDAGAEIEELKKIVHVLFLNLPWEARQMAKRMLTDREQARLAEMLEGAPNW